ncbi:MAG: hypothetical protein LBJ69_00085 [Holosporales bacterium]|jgi:hypothetical protein|nr:hypothetical protein [Holosporales bacterium]
MGNKIRKYFKLMTAVVAIIGAAHSARQTFRPEAVWISKLSQVGRQTLVKATTRLRQVIYDVAGQSFDEPNLLSTAAHELNDSITRAVQSTHLTSFQVACCINFQLLEPHERKPFRKLFRACLQHGFYPGFGRPTLSPTIEQIADDPNYLIALSENGEWVAVWPTAPDPPGTPLMDRGQLNLPDARRALNRLGGYEAVLTALQAPCAASRVPPPQPGGESTDGDS